jgi:hypothetical protein
MEFTPASQNGIVPPTELLSIPSRFGILVSNTSTYYGKPLLIKAVSDAIMYKTEPVTFYSVKSGTTSVLGTSTFMDTASAVLVLNNISTGTHDIYATWPGEGLYAPTTTINNKVSVVVAAGQDLPGNFTLTAGPTSGTVIAGSEVNVTFTATFSTLDIITGNVIFYRGSTQLGSVFIEDNKAVLSVNNLPSGDNIIKAVWPGGNINGVNYQGRSAQVTYNVVRGFTINQTMSVAVTPSYGIFNEGNIKIAATLNTSTELLGNVYFSIDNTPLYYAPFLGNTATIEIANNAYEIGNRTIEATWDGNQTGYPRYIEKTTSTTWTVYERDFISFTNFTVTPRSAYGYDTVFSATLNKSDAVGNVGFYTGNTLLGSGPIVGNSATFTTRSLAVGTYTVYAYYDGRPITPKYFSTVSSTATMVITEGIEIPASLLVTITNDSYAGTTDPYIINENQTIKATISTSTVLSGPVRFYVDDVLLGTNNWNGSNTATFTTTFATTGSHSIQARWPGQSINNKFYSTKISNVSTVTSLAGYTMFPNLVQTATNRVIVGQPFSLTDVITTSSTLNGTTAGNISFYYSGDVIERITTTTASVEFSEDSILLLDSLLSSTSSYVGWAFAKGNRISGWGLNTDMTGYDSGLQYATIDNEIYYPRHDLQNTMMRPYSRFYIDNPYKNIYYNGGSGSVIGTNYNFSTYPPLSEQDKTWITDHPDTKLIIYDYYQPVLTTSSIRLNTLTNSISCNEGTSWANIGDKLLIPANVILYSSDINLKYTVTGFIGIGTTSSAVVVSPAFSDTTIQRVEMNRERNVISKQIYNGASFTSTITDISTVTTDVSFVTVVKDSVTHVIDRPLGTRNWVNNVSTITSTFNEIGTYEFTSIWEGGYVDDHRLYLGKTSNISTITVYPTVTPAVSISAPVISLEIPFVYTGSVSNLNDFDVRRNTVDFYQVDVGLLGTTNTTINNTLSIKVTTSKNVTPSYQRKAYATLNGAYGFNTSTSSIVTTDIVPVKTTATCYVNLYEIGQDPLVELVGPPSSLGSTSSNTHRFFVAFANTTTSGSADIQWKDLYNENAYKTINVSNGIGYFDTKINYWAPGDNPVSVSLGGTTVFNGKIHIYPKYTMGFDLVGTPTKVEWKLLGNWTSGYYDINGVQKKLSSRSVNGTATITLSNLQSGDHVNLTNFTYNGVASLVTSTQVDIRGSYILSGGGATYEWVSNYPRYYVGDIVRNNQIPGRDPYQVAVFRCKVEHVPNTQTEPWDRTDLWDEIYTS